MSLLPSVGTITYNGYTFNGAVKSSLAGRPVYDDAGRTVTHVVYSLSVDSYIPEPTPGAGTGTSINDIRQRLSTPGQSLSITNTGLGTFDINVADTQDVVWGPKPTLVGLYAVGSAQCHRVIWNCDVAIPECPNAETSGVLMAFNYETSYRIDADGFTRRTYSGYLEIPLTRIAGGRQVPDTAMSYRDNLNIPLLPGFKRAERSFVLSEDKRRLTFTITDEELPDEGLPNGCTNATGRFAVRSQDLTLIAFVITLSATYTVAPLASGGRKAAWDAFYALLFDRLQAAVDQYGQADGGVIMSSFTAEEGLYMDSRNVSFEASWLVNNGDVSDIMIGSGMWNVVPGTDWHVWSTSPGVDEAQQIGGTSDVVQPPGEIIIDLCGGSATVPEDLTKTLEGKRDAPTAPSLRSRGWIDYQFKVENHIDPGTIVLKALPTSSMSTTIAGTSTMTTDLIGQLLDGFGPVIRTAEPPDAAPSPFLNFAEEPPPWLVSPDLALPPPIAIGTGNPSSGPSQTPTTSGDTWQQRVDPSQDIVLRGYGVRVGARVECPSLKSYNHHPLVSIKPQYFAERIVGYLCGSPVFHSEWILRYRQLSERLT